MSEQERTGEGGRPTFATKLVKTKTPGIYKRGDRYVVVWRHRGKQHKSFHRTYAEARGEGTEAGGRPQAVDQATVRGIRHRLA